jgi:hypothetical protein
MAGKSAETQEYFILRSMQYGGIINQIIKNI